MLYVNFEITVTKKYNLDTPNTFNVCKWQPKHV